MGHLGLFLVFLIAIAILLRLDFVFYIVYVLVGLWLVARFGYKRGLESLQWKRTYAKRAFLGDKVTVETSVRSRFWLPLPWLRITDAVPVNLFGGDKARQVVSLERGESFLYQFQLDCSRRGLYQIGPLTLSAGDPVGFFDFNYQPSSVSDLVVYPQIMPLVELGLDSL